MKASGNQTIFRSRLCLQPDGDLGKAGIEDENKSARRPDDFERSKPSGRVTASSTQLLGPSCRNAYVRPPPSRSRRLGKPNARKNDFTAVSIEPARRSNRHAVYANRFQNPDFGQRMPDSSFVLLASTRTIFIGVAQMRSGLTNTNTTRPATKSGPFRLAPGGFHQYCTDTEFEFHFQPSDIGTWFPCKSRYFALMTHRASDKFFLANSRNPTAKELYLQAVGRRRRISQRCLPISTQALTQNRPP